MRTDEVGDFIAMPEKETEVSPLQPKRSPLIFISHDSRDAAIAEAFSKLLSSVSAGVLKSFRSSDKKGNQGIEYGVEWYPEIMKKLEASSDVVCLLTPSSVGRPWILYEVGVAKGKLDTPVHGIALGIPLQNASSGPFAQFQNSDDSEDALTQLVIQLVKRIPDSEPDRDVVRSRVDAFRNEILPLLEAADGADDGGDEADGASVAQLFEEVKVMFQDLPGRVERRFDPERGLNRKRRFSEGMMYEATHIFSKEAPAGISILMTASLFREEFPWIYDLAIETYRKVSMGSREALSSLKDLERVLHTTLGHPIFREIAFRSVPRSMSLEFMVDSLSRAISLTRDRIAHRTSDNALPSNWSDERLEKLREMWVDGKTATEIAEELGGVSRNAVIGKAHRLGLQSRPVPVSTDEEAE